MHVVGRPATHNDALAAGGGPVWANQPVAIWGYNDDELAIAATCLAGVGVGYAHSSLADEGDFLVTYWERPRCPRGALGQVSGAKVFGMTSNGKTESGWTPS